MRKNEWFLVAFAEHIRGCNLSTNRQPQHDPNRFRVWNESVFVWSHAPVQGVTFYPAVRYSGAPVYPERWTSDSTEPVLRCRLMGWDAQSAGYSHEQQIADGWKGVGSGDGATKWIHVDDLEKIEGPPPDGPF